MKITMARNSKEFEDFFKEAQDIESNKDQDGDVTEDEQSKTPDEGEVELNWLQDAGYGHLVSKFEDGKELEDDIFTEATSSLTRTQAAAVRKRVDTLNATIRKRQKHKEHQKVDVRDVFPQQPESPTGSPGPISPRSGRHVRRGSGKGSSSSSSSLFKNKGVYSVTVDGIDYNKVGGIEGLSIQATKEGSSVITLTGATSPPLSPVQDSDVQLMFLLDDETPKKPVQENTENRGSQIKEVPAARTEMPNITLVQEPLGRTSINDLSPQDQSSLKTLSLIELTALFDVHNITYSKRKAKRKFKEGGLFGVPISTLTEHDIKLQPNCTVPLFFRQMIKYLEKNCLHEEGILRIPGSASRIKQLRQNFEDSFYSGHFSWDDIRPNDIAALLKQFLRELPVPLLTFDLLDAFAQIERIPELKQQLQAMNLLILMLPQTHRDTLELLVKFLKKISDLQEQNKMTLTNVAMIMAPNLFLVQNRKIWNAHNKSREQEITMAAGTSNIVKKLIHYHPLLWTVPSFMLSQVRHQYMSEQAKANREKSVSSCTPICERKVYIKRRRMQDNIMKFLGKKDKSEAYRKQSNEEPLADGVIRVQAPGLTKSSTLIQLERDMTCNDILTRFRRVSQPSLSAPNIENSHTPKPNFKPEYHESLQLYEVGGNIGERCLDLNTNMLALYRINRNAEWIVKIRQEIA
ncbi:unnamed protein product [Owenia fusiformis]|uniref:Uncharacterized protein n=1 Tax=Owenia fusiformis TaxID=6347 RepID=A0A8J1TY42_OWEFU|nr:unnamed protein product [Owenia fusiformis]